MMQSVGLKVSDCPKGYGSPPDHSQRVRTEGPMAPKIFLDGQRPAQYVFSRHVEQILAKIGRPKVRAKEPAAGG
jgi:hypothetical protein